MSDNRTASSRIALIGNCQIGTIAAAMRFYRPKSFIKIIYSWETPEKYESIEPLIDDLRGFDHVFTHHSYDGVLANGGFDRMMTALPRVCRIPIIVFPAFHPDLIYLYSQDDADVLQPVQSPIGVYNSALAIFGYLNGLSIDETLGLYRDDVYELLGYLDFWPSSQKALMQAMHEAGLPMERHFLRWARSGCFMHSINHPKAHVLIDVAYELLRKAGIEVVNQGCDSYIADNEIADAIWPVYPPIASRYGIRGSNIFKKPDYATKSADTPQFYDVREFVTESYRSYQSFDKYRFRSDRFATLMDDAALRDRVLGKVTG